MSLGKALAGLKGEIGPQLGMVSTEVPLISNLDVLRNIGLIYQHHRHASVNETYSFVLQCLKRFGMEKVANKRNPALSDRERFYVKILRAAMVTDAVIVVDRPFIMLPDLEESTFVYETLSKIDDLFSRCDILDYVYEKNRYGMTNDEQT